RIWNSLLIIERTKNLRACICRPIQSCCLASCRRHWIMTVYTTYLTIFPRSFMLKSDRWIRKMSQEHDMINPFSEKQVREGVISYGLSSYGYDLRVADEFKIFTNVNSSIVDPKKFDEKSFVTIRTDICIVPPNSFALARSVEYFKIPRDVLTI